MSVDRFRQSHLARMLGLKSVRTIQRRRLENPSIYAPDVIDSTGHPLYEAATIQKIVDWERAHGQR